MLVVIVRKTKIKSAQLLCVTHIDRYDAEEMSIKKRSIHCLEEKTRNFD